MAIKRVYTIEDRLLTASIAMVEQWLMAAWQQYYPDEEEFRVATVRSADDLRSTAEAIDRTQSIEDTRPDLAYPYGNLIMTNISPDTDKGPFNKRHIGVVTARSQNNDKVDISNNIPVRIGLGLSIRSDNLDHIIKIASILMFSAPKITLLLESTSGFVYGVGLNIDPELTIPGADMGHPAKEFRFDTSLLLSTYLVRTRTQGVIREIRFGMADATGRSLNEVMREFDSLDVLLNSRYSYTDIVNRNSTRYRES